MIFLRVYVLYVILYLNKLYNFQLSLSNCNLDCELSVAQLVRFRVLESAHLGSSPGLGKGTRIFLDLF